MAVSVELGKPLEEFLNTLVSSGRYGSRSEVLREGVRLVQERENKLAALDILIKEGLDSANAGQLKPANQAFDELRTMLKAEYGKG